MTQTTTGKGHGMEIASALDNITIGLEELAALLQIYDEHREEELAGVDPKEPYTVAVLIARQDLGLALLRAIEDKANQLKELTAATMKRAYSLARGEEAPAAESEG